MVPDAYITSHFTCADAYYYQFTRKIFELLGIVPSAISCDYNNQKVCDRCYDSLIHAGNNDSYVFNNVRYYCTGKNEFNCNQWASEKFLISDCNEYNFIY